MGNFFSVIIPTYNRMSFLKIAVESVLEQTFTDYELIIVDDGSLDETKEMLRKYRDERITYLYQEHSGVSKARNTGLRNARGEYITFLDSDDRYCRDKLKITYGYIKKYPDYKIFHTEEIWYRNGELLPQKDYHKKPSGFCFANAVKLCSISISTVAVKKELFDLIGAFDENLPACEDYDFWLRATAQFPVFLIPEYLTIKEGGHKDQQSKKYPAMDKFRIWALKKILESETLSEENYQIAYAELSKKIGIYIQGALKRGKDKEIAEYWGLLKRLKRNFTKGIDNLAQLLEREFHFKANRNQLRELERLYFEIIRRERTSSEEITNYLKVSTDIERYSGRNRFFALKNALINRRFPLTSQRQKIDTKTLFLNTLQRPLKGILKAQKEFKPLAIYVEKAVRKSYLVDNIRKHFPEVEIEELNYYSQYLKKNRFSPAELKKPIIFIIREQWDFLRPCPCTRYHICCGYWILNLGFGCPFDCSYCFLQQYANFPGILLPANLEDFFQEFDIFYKKIKKPIRIGTGEFCDSLALDHLTAYSTKLIPYFKDKNVHFEMKTKSNNIKNLLVLKPSEHIVISWSVNPESLVETEELGTAGLKERILAAKELQDRNYSIGFHFDPIIYFEGWQGEYKELIHYIYSTLRAPFAWISLGTLRSNRQLKTVVEKRFPKSAIFYGELFLGEDKKLRYPKFLRMQIYKNMLEWIREYDTKTPIYLCMESADIWGELENEFDLSA